MILNNNRATYRDIQNSASPEEFVNDTLTAVSKLIESMSMVCGNNAPAVDILYDARTSIQYLKEKEKDLRVMLAQTSAKEYKNANP